MAAIVLRGDARSLPLPDESVDLIVTSPPYFGLRSYTDTVECLTCINWRREGRDVRQAWPDYDQHVRDVHQQHYDGQIGSEATPAEFVAALISCTRDWIRVLRPSGSLFVNLGDKYSGAKSLLGLPWRYALGCVDDLGLILRAEIVWAKPNGLPESVTDRVRRSHEQLFHFTRRPRYFAAVDEIREQYDAPRATRTMGNVDPGRGDFGKPMQRRDAVATMNPLGKLPGSVWTIPSAPLTVPAHLGIDHFAAFPPALIRPIVLGWSPSGVCTACGEGRRPVTVADYQTVVAPTPDRRVAALSTTGHSGRGRGNEAPYGNARRETTITGYACACPTPDAPTRPAVVLDPFGGTGTTALVASVLGRTGITVDRSADYCRLAKWRTQDPGERCRVIGAPKPPPVPEGQDALFGT